MPPEAPVVIDRVAVREGGVCDPGGAGDCDLDVNGEAFGETVVEFVVEPSLDEA